MISHCYAPAKSFDMGKMKLLLPALLAGCLLVAISSGCTKPPPPPQVTNKPPVADAGPDKTIMKPRDNTILSGGLSKDDDGSIVSYKWKVITGPNSPDLSNTLMTDRQPYEQAVFSLVEGVYQFELTVTDNGGADGKDTVKLTALPDSLTLDPFRMKKYERLNWQDSCVIRINNISSVIPGIGSFQVYMASYYAGGPMSGPFVPSTGWFQLQPVRSSSFWYEIRNDVLIIHASADIICDWADSYYNVLIKWN